MSRKKIRLSREALVLHSWLCLNSGPNGALLNSKSFKKWFEDEMGDLLPVEKLSSALDELSEYHLISIIGWQIQPQDLDRQRFHID